MNTMAQAACDDLERRRVIEIPDAPELTMSGGSIEIPNELEDWDVQDLDWWRDNLSLDPNNLMWNVVHQPNLMESIGRLSSKAQTAAKRAKSRAGLVESHAMSEIRGDPASYGLDKVTESSVAAVVRSHPAVQEANEQLLDAEELARDIGAVVTAYEHRRSMLREATNLLLQGIWSDDIKPQEGAVRASGQFMSRKKKEALKDDTRQRIVQSRRRQKD